MLSQLKMRFKFVTILILKINSLFPFLFYGCHEINFVKNSCNFVEHILRAPVGKLNLMLQLPWLDVDVSNLHCLANYTSKLSHVTVFRIIDLNPTRW